VEAYLIVSSSSAAFDIRIPFCLTQMNSKDQREDQQNRRSFYHVRGKRIRKGKCSGERKDGVGS
jgi:hypothetical protein